MIHFELGVFASGPVRGLFKLAVSRARVTEARQVRVKVGAGGGRSSCGVGILLQMLSFSCSLGRDRSSFHSSLSDCFGEVKPCEAR
jgi:hypothetical protein